jgi:hypothetical protein
MLAPRRAVWQNLLVEKREIQAARHRSSERDALAAIAA